MVIRNLVPWTREEVDPFRTFERFFRDFDLAPLVGTTRDVGNFAPRVNVEDREKEIAVTAELPGLEEKDVEVSLEPDSLTLKGEKKAEHEEKGKSYYRVERTYGAFHRTIELPCEVETDKAEATFKKGVLTVTLPKSVRSQRETKRLTIKNES